MPYRDFWTKWFYQPIPRIYRNRFAAVCSLQISHLFFVASYIELPFMILPIFNVLDDMDNNLINASYDLGATKWETFRHVIFPLSMNGVRSGVQSVFIPSLSLFMLTRLIGGPSHYLGDCHRAELLDQWQLWYGFNYRCSSYPDYVYHYVGDQGKERTMKKYLISI